MAWLINAKWTTSLIQNVSLCPNNNLMNASTSGFWGSRYNDNWGGAMSFQEANA